MLSLVRWDSSVSVASPPASAIASSSVHRAVDRLDAVPLGGAGAASAGAITWPAVADSPLVQGHFPAVS